ncbi:MAG: hypothetical protein ACFFAS_01580 [Promethearchaeota archaeon]
MFPIICIPIGDLSFDQPYGIDAAGNPVRLKGYVKDIQLMMESFLFFTLGKTVLSSLNPGVKTGRGIVGVRRIS